MTSNAQRGSYYKARTKRWLEARGYQVAHLETMRFLFRQGQPPMPVKRDQFGADLLAVSARSVIFVQVKGGDTCRTGHFPEARRKFAQYTFPPWTRQWVIAWPARSRAPRIVEMKRLTDGETQQENREAEGREEATA